MNPLAKVAVCLLLLIAAPISSRAGWLAIPDRAGLAYFADPKRGESTFSEALAKWAAEDPTFVLRNIGVSELLPEPAFQQEIIARLAKEAPAAWQAAQRSAGNMHNPKMIALQPLFDRAVLATALVQEMSTALRNHGLEISRVGQEKFEMRRNEKGEVRLTGMMWLTVTEIRKAGAELQRGSSRKRSCWCSGGPINATARPGKRLSSSSSVS